MVTWWASFFALLQGNCKASKMALVFRLNGGLTGLDWARAKWGGFATKYIKWGEKQAVSTLMAAASAYRGWL